MAPINRPDTSKESHHRGDRLSNGCVPSLLRGLLDGDGSIVDGTYDGTGKARGRRYRVLKVRFISASETHVSWLRRRITAEFGLSGSVRREERVFRLTYSKRAAVQLLHRMYPEPDVPCLARKHLIWLRFQRECPKDAARGKMGTPAQVVYLVNTIVRGAIA